MTLGFVSNPTLC